MFIQKPKQGIASLLAAASLLAHAGTAGAQNISVTDIQPTPGTAIFETGRVIVKLRDDVDAPSALSAQEAFTLGLATAAHKTSGGELVYDISPQIILREATTQGLSQTIDGIVAELIDRADVEYAQRDFTVYPLLEPNDTNYPLQWHYRTKGRASRAVSGWDQHACRLGCDNWRSQHCGGCDRHRPSVFTRRCQRVRQFHCLVMI